MKRLQSEPEIMQLVQNFVPLELDAGSNDFQTFAQQYRPPGNGIPMMFVVSSTGQELDKISGSPQGAGLKTFLTRSLSRAALAPPAEGDLPGDEDEDASEPNQAQSEAEMRTRQRRLETLVRRAQNFVDKGDFTAAAKIVGPLVDDPETPTNDDLDRLVAGFEQMAAQAVDVVHGRVESGQVLLAAVALVEAERQLAPLVSAQTLLTEARDAIAAAADGETALRHAAAVDVARAAEAQRDLKGAIEGYQAVIETFPATPVAQMSQLRMGQLQAARPAASAEDLSKAESMFTMAKAIAERDPDKAKKYLEKVIETAPADSAVAGQAGALLQSLKK
ncbi:MAG: tetratricopeptide repeat protein [Pirellulales bacterium]